MNERVRELWAQCVIKHTKTPMNWQNAADEFAKLIVLECVNVNYNSAFHDGEFCARELLEHFGVEE